MISTEHTPSRSSERRRRARAVVADSLLQIPDGALIAEGPLLDRHPELLPELAEELKKAQRIRDAVRVADEQVWSEALRRLRRDWSRDRPVDSTADHSDRPNEIPARIGRYRVEGLIGEGGFGRVFLAVDDELDRRVAIKTPFRQRCSDGELIVNYLAEARVLARLDHPAIVPVYDAGHTDDGSWYVVSKWIQGIDLAARLRRSKMPHEEAVRLTLEIARALHYAHAQGIVHRDIKPANILLDSQEKPCLADFGLAARDDELLDAGQWAGTPAYMSPEQARGEAHRVDGRSDIFSLGVVLYEALTGQKPFQAATREALLDQIVAADPKPLSDWDESIPAELERICQKMLAKRAADRYATARDLVADLRMYQSAAGSSRSSKRTGGRTGGPSVSFPKRAPVAAEEATGRALVVPKGLRSFDASDASFFLELLPGPRGRQGIPENLRHWKARIEELDADETFAVGLFYGPSGCGKSSLVRAGLLPLMAAHVESVYVEAASDDTESQLLKRLHKKVPDLPVEAGLAKCLAMLRRGFGIRSGHKLLIVIDQFEQWLSGRCEADRRPLVEALRQCDGSRVQCLLLVRDDFWLAVSRLMSELEVELIQGRNTALVDLFDRQHARQVLSEFGRAYGQLPNDPNRWSSLQHEFLDRAVDGLTEEEKVIPVRLALFAEMVKGRPWTVETIRSVGGSRGVGVTFLEETFCTRTANPRNRTHERAARAVLAALLPQPGSPIKGHVRSYPELLDLSGYGSRPREFKELMRILDGETRLLTPADLILEAPGGDPSLPSVRYYQLTHDYLVPALREWLTKKQQATPAGRAALRLTERSAMWNSTRERRQLPSLWEWLSIHALTRESSWTTAERSMMQVAGRRHRILAVAWSTTLLLLLLAGAELTTSARTLFLKVRAGTAPVWLAFGQEQAIFPLLQADADPTLRTRLIHRLSPLLISSERLVSRASEPLAPSIRRALLLSAGEMAPDRKAGSEDSVDAQRPVSNLLLMQLSQLFQQDPDPGIHSAAEWALRQFQREGEIARLVSQLRRSVPPPNRQWYLTSEEHTLVVIPGPARFRIGASLNQSGNHEEPSRDAWIPRSFSIASKEVTGSQFQRFLASNPRLAPSAAAYMPSPPEHPALCVTWYQAAAYCNWLSEKERLGRDQWCFIPNGTDEYAAGMQLAPDWVNRRGYRLPTEIEWEYACSAGAETAWYFGSDRALLGKYVRGEFNSNGEPSLVGSLKPNDFGLFDMLGNAAEWCLDAATGELDRISDDTRLIVRGGSYGDDISRVRNSTRVMMLPAHPATGVGFRVARSYP